MNYEAAILYAAQRMRESGKKPDEYHYEPVEVFGTEQERTDGLITVQAYNELYILINPRNYYGLGILSDNSAFDSDHPDKNGVQEFTGLISFKRIAKNWNLDHLSPTGVIQTIPVEFLRVVIY